MGVKILHCADIHLDSPFALLTAQEAEKRRQELRSAFTSTIMYAKANGIKIFLISGDLFDREFVTRDTIEAVSTAIAAYPECTFLISPGNHDPIDNESQYKAVRFPQNAVIFDGTKRKISFDELGVDIYGVGFTSPVLESSPVLGYGELDPEKINILVCHGDMSSAQSKKGAISKEDISASKFDYIALGHIHKPSGLLREGRTFYCYPGCIEGRDFGETGRHGFMVGIVGKNDVNLKFEPISIHKYEILEVDLTECDTKTRALDEIRTKILQFGGETDLRLILTGEPADAFVISVNELKNGIENCPSHIQIIDKTLPRIDMTSLETDISLRGIFYNKMMEIINSSKPDSDEYKIAADALRYGISALNDREFLDF